MGPGSLNNNVKVTDIKLAAFSDVLIKYHFSVLLQLNDLTFCILKR